MWLPPFIAWKPDHNDDAARRAYLDAFRRRLADFDHTAPIAYPGLDAYRSDTYQLKE